MRLVSVLEYLDEETLDALEDGRIGDALRDPEEARIETTGDP